jgi:hypothetical protein
LASAPVLALVIAQACAPPTQARVRIRSTLTCDQLNGVNIVVGPSSEVAEARVADRAVNTTARDCVPDPAGFVDLGTVVLAPGEERGAIVVVAGTKDVPGVPPRAADLCGVRAPSGPGDYKDCIVARRRFSYVDNKTLEFTITLDNACINQPCDAATETCSAGKCVTAELSCSGEACAVPNEGADAGAVDTGAAVIDVGMSTPDSASPPADATADAAPDVLEPLVACQPRCPGLDGGIQQCASGQECCARTRPNNPRGTCVGSADACLVLNDILFVRLCCTEPCSATQACIAESAAPDSGSDQRWSSRCVRKGETFPANALVLCTQPSDCPGADDNCTETPFLSAVRYCSKRP